MSISAIAQVLLVKSGFRSRSNPPFKTTSYINAGYDITLEPVLGSRFQELAGCQHDADTLGVFLSSLSPERH
jgi:hypothetical protein